MGAITARDLCIQKIRRNWQDHGLSTVVRKAIAFLMRPFYVNQTYRLYAIDLRCSCAHEQITVEGIEFRILSAGDTRAIEEIERISEWLSGTLEMRIRKGALCIAAFENDHVAGFNLISFGKIFMPIVNLHRGFRRDEAWSEQIAVSKSFRKKGLGAALRYNIFAELRKRRFRKLYGGALVDNIPSLALARRVGFHEFADIQFMRLLGNSRWIYRRVK